MKKFEKAKKRVEKKEEKIDEKIIEAISELLTDICEESSEEININNCEGIKVFTSKIIPQITIKAFIERLIKYSKIEESTLILILVYIDRVCDSNKISLSFYNIHKLILASFLLAIKFNEDVYFSNDFYSKVGGVPLSELDEMEYEFLILTNFNIYVSTELYNKYYESFINSYTNDDEESDDDDDNLGFKPKKEESVKSKGSSKKVKNERKSSDISKKTTFNKKTSNLGVKKMASAQEKKNLPEKNIKKHIRSKS